MIVWPPDPVPTISVEQWVVWTVDILPRLVDDADADDLTRACMWLSNILDMPVDETVELVRSEFERTESSVADMVQHLVDAQISKGVDRALQVSSGVPKEWKMTKRTGCECALCSGLGGDATDCKYVDADVSVVDRLIANIDVELAAHLWTKPLSLYQIRRAQNYWDAMRMEHRREHPPGDPRTSAPTSERRRAIAARLKKKHRRR